MRNRILRTIQAALLGLVTSMYGITYKTIGFWIMILIMCIQWAKEEYTERQQ